MAAKDKLKLGSLIIAMAGISTFLVTVDNVRRDIFNKEQAPNVKVADDSYFPGSVDELSAKETIPVDGTDDPSVATEGLKNQGFMEADVKSSDVFEGTLAVYDVKHPAPEASNNVTVDLIEFKNEYYTLIEEGVRLNADAAEAFNDMMADYFEYSQLSDFVVYGTTDTYTGEGSYCPRQFEESLSGYCVDLALNGWDGVMAYDGYGTQGWIEENCYKYGFIVRYPQGKEEQTGEAYCPWHLRYVGAAHAEAMHKNGICLEEYLERLKEKNYEDPYTITVDNTAYKIYTAPVGESGSTIMVPVGGGYDVSGNSSDGVIVTIPN